jgi:hypothetical protein
MSKVALRDFQPINAWKPDLDGPKWEDENPQHLIDKLLSSCKFR